MWNRVGWTSQISLLLGICSLYLTPIRGQNITDLMKTKFICHAIKYDLKEVQVYPVDNVTGYAGKFYYNGGTIYIVLPEFYQTLFTDAKSIATEITQAKENTNVVFCDWTGIAKKFKFHEMAEHLESAAGVLINFLRNAEVQKVILPGDTHLIGEGLGAHFWGLVARKLVADKQVARITGLDPLGICFDEGYARHCSGKTFKVGLVKTDATFVDVLFTGREFWGICDQPVLDDKMDMCHSCFFANGGYRQPGCGYNGDTLNILSACSHKRASTLYVESVWNLKENFNSSGCRTATGTMSPCDVMLNKFGFNTDVNSEGIFGFATNDESPFAIPLICWSDVGNDGGISSFTDCHISDHYIT